MCDKIKMFGININSCKIVLPIAFHLNARFFYIDFVAKLSRFYLKQVWTESLTTSLVTGMGKQCFLPLTYPGATGEVVNILLIYNI